MTPAAPAPRTPRQSGQPRQAGQPGQAGQSGQPRQASVEGGARADEKPVVLARGLVVGYGSTAVCAPVDFSLRPGQVLALVGSNGSGKSTVLRAVLGLLEPLGGRLEVFGAPVDERSAVVRGRVAGVLDDDAWFPGLSVREHLLLTAAGHGVRNTSSVVDDALDTFGLEDHEDAVPSALSSGQRRRLLLAAGFVRPRDLLVLDEPEQRLDAAMRGELAELLRAEARKGTAVLLATHDPDLLLALGARAVLLDEDRCRRLSAADAVAAITGAR